MKKIVLTLALSWLFLAVLFAQTASEALLYGTHHNGGTARYTAMGGSMGALGGDFSTLSVNPAGIGVYKSSEFTFTPTLFYSNNSTNFYNENNSDSRITFNFNNVGVVWAVDLASNPDETAVRTLQFAMGINRINNYNSRMMFDGFNNESSFCTGLAQRANIDGYPESSLPGMAYDANLLFYPLGGNQLQCDMPNGDVQQKGLYETDGSLQEFVLSGGANLNDRVYLGFTFAFPFLSYNQYFSYYETDTDDLNPNYHGLDYHETIETSGSGVSGKFGVIVRATDWVRVGAAIHTPTFFSYMSDDYTSSIHSYFDEGLTDLDRDISSPFSQFEYELTTPFRTIGSLGFVFGPYGLLNVDYEYVDYMGLKFSPTIDFTDVNKQIGNSYGTQHAVRIGTEWRVNVLRLRAGYS